jgi:hypothetical protein
MKMLLVICPEDRQQEIRDRIWRHDIHAYTELKDVTGEGLKGKKLGSRLWPDTSIIVFTVIPDEKVDELLTDLRQCSEALFPDEGMRVFVMPAEQVV